MLIPINSGQVAPIVYKSTFLVKLWKRGIFRARLLVALRIYSLQTLGIRQKNKNNVIICQCANPDKFGTSCANLRAGIVELVFAYACACAFQNPELLNYQLSIINYQLLIINCQLSPKPTPTTAFHKFRTKSRPLFNNHLFKLHRLSCIQLNQVHTGFKI